jgi:hypothetical protein
VYFCSATKQVISSTGMSRSSSRVRTAILVRGPPCLAAIKICG